MKVHLYHRLTHSEVHMTIQTASAEQLHDVNNTQEAQHNNKPAGTLANRPTPLPTHK